MCRPFRVPDNSQKVVRSDNSGDITQKMALRTREDATNPMPIITYSDRTSCPEVVRKLSNGHRTDNCPSLEGRLSGRMSEEVFVRAPRKRVPHLTEAHRASLRQLGADVRRFRKAQGLRLDQLALLSGVSERALRDLEHGETVPNLATVLAVFGALHIRFSFRVGVPTEVQIGG